MVTTNCHSRICRVENHPSFSFKYGNVNDTKNTIPHATITRVSSSTMHVVIVLVIPRPRTACERDTVVVVLVSVCV